MHDSHNAYLPRIELKVFKPATYGGVLVTPDITLRAMHKVIQAAMGWDDAHLYGHEAARRMPAPPHSGVPMAGTQWLCLDTAAPATNGFSPST